MKKMLARFGTTKTILIIIAGLAIIYVGYKLTFGKKGPDYQFVDVKRGAIAEEVNVTGNTTASQSVDLTFESGGTIASVNADVGARVATGDVIARLDSRDLAAQLAQAQASVDAAVAKLHALQAGAQPADIQASEAALAKANQDLTNLYTGAINTLSDAYTKANDGVRNQTAGLFNNPETANPTLTFTVTNSQTLNNAQSERALSSSELNTWQNELKNLSSASSASVADAALQAGAKHLASIRMFLGTVWDALNQQAGLSPTTVDAYKAEITSGQSEVNTANTSVNTVIQNIASQKIAVQQAQAQLDLKKAGSTQNDIDAQAAAVAQAQASAQAIQVKIAKASLISPIAGVITTQNAKVGQITSPGTILATVISDSNLEVDANIPETDIGKVAVGNPVSMTLDAFPNETFTGKLFYINPGQTTISGVVNYKVKVSFDQADARIKSGLTANMVIKTIQKNDVLVLPQFAVLQNDDGAFVEILDNGAVKNVPVTLGIHDGEGNVEIVSGVTEGEQVLNIGLKQGS